MQQFREALPSTPFKEGKLILFGFLKEKNMTLLEKTPNVSVSAPLQSGLTRSICRGTDPG